MITRRTLLQSLAVAPARPNIVLFISDDHGYRESSLYGNSQVRTPALEAIARDGTVFTNLFVGSPTCVPSRAILMSGLMPARNGAEANHSGLREGIRTLPSYLSELGYKVAHFGKSHFQPASNYRDWEAVPSEIKGERPLFNDLDTTAVEKWLQSRRGITQPMCLVVGSHSPHVYWDSKEGYDPAAIRLPPNLVDTRETREFMAAYYSDITKMDRQLGEVHHSVQRHLGRNTVFIYMADNGAQWPFAKWTVYDGGIRLPLVISWPQKMPGGRRSEAMISSADFVPTLIELAGGRAPAGIDGRSFAELLAGNTAKHRDEIYATHSADGKMNSYPARCIRTRQFKYILNLHPEFRFSTHMDQGIDADGVGWWRSWVEKAKTDRGAAEIVRRYQRHPREELYDVAKDPYEMKNLADRSELRRTVADLRQKLESWMKTQGDQQTVFGAPRLLREE